MDLQLTISRIILIAHSLKAYIGILEPKHLWSLKQVAGI